MTFNLFQARTSDDALFRYRLRTEARMQLTYLYVRNDFVVSCA